MLHLLLLACTANTEPESPGPPEPEKAKVQVLEVTQRIDPGQPLSESNTRAVDAPEGLGFQLLSPEDTDWRIASEPLFPGELVRLERLARGTGIDGLVPNLHRALVLPLPPAAVASMESGDRIRLYTRVGHPDVALVPGVFTAVHVDRAGGLTVIVPREPFPLPEPVYVARAAAAERHYDHEDDTGAPGSERDAPLVAATDIPPGMPIRMGLLEAGATGLTWADLQPMPFIERPTRGTPSGWVTRFRILAGEPLGLDRIERTSLENYQTLTLPLPKGAPVVASGSWVELTDGTGTPIAWYGKPRPFTVRETTETTLSLWVRESGALALLSRPGAVDGATQLAIRPARKFECDDHGVACPLDGGHPGFLGRVQRTDQGRSKDRDE